MTKIKYELKKEDNKELVLVEKCFKTEIKKMKMEKKDL